jgi:hypothetical protein
MRCHHERLTRYHSTVLRKPVSNVSRCFHPNSVENSCGIYPVSPVMAGAIGDKGNESVAAAYFTAWNQLVQKCTPGSGLFFRSGRRCNRYVGDVMRKSNMKRQRRDAALGGGNWSQAGHHGRPQQGPRRPAQGNSVRSRSAGFVQRCRCSATRHGLTAETAVGGLEDSEDYKGSKACNLNPERVFHRTAICTVC